jgi:hypothetical protein
MGSWFTFNGVNFSWYWELIISLVSIACICISFAGSIFGLTLTSNILGLSISLSVFGAVSILIVGYIYHFDYKGCARATAFFLQIIHLILAISLIASVNSNWSDYSDAGRATYYLAVIIIILDLIFIIVTCHETRICSCCYKDDERVQPSNDSSL